MTTQNKVEFRNEIADAGWTAGVEWIKGEIAAGKIPAAGLTVVAYALMTGAALAEVVNTYHSEERELSVGDYAAVLRRFSNCSAVAKALVKLKVLTSDSAEQAGLGEY